MGEWGSYEALTPTEKMTVWLHWLRGAMQESNCLFGVVYFFDLGGGGSVFINCFVFFSPNGIYIPVIC